MQPEASNPDLNSGSTAGTPCSNCGALMPPELRFCRSCGSRLGEGVAEYTETVRFQNAPTAAAAANPTTPYGRLGSGPQAFGPAAAAQMQWIHKKKKKKLSGMTWLFIGLLLFFVFAGAFTAVVRNVRQSTGAAVSLPRAYVGVDEFKDGDGGVTFNNVETPDGPADKAGLLGGDLITSFDGHVVKNADEITDLLRQTTIGKAVEVIFIRDGETKKTLLTPVGREELRQLERAFSRRPEGLGRLGFDNDNRVLVPGTNTYGVQLEEIQTSLPADMAGIKVGDIVIQFGEIPIRTPGELRARVRRALPYSVVDVVIMRGNERLTIPVKMGKQR